MSGTQTPEASKSRYFTRNRILKFSGLMLAIAIALMSWRLAGRNEQPAGTYAVVETGDISKTISATGKLQAVRTVQVGSQVSGRIAELYADFNSRVKAGQIVAKLDPSLLEAQLKQAQANLDNGKAKLETAENAVANAEANLASAEASRERMRAAQQDAERAYLPLKEIAGTGAVSNREVEAAQATLAQATAQFDQAEAQVLQAKAQLQSARSQVNEARAQIRQMQASVDLAAANLDYSIIRAPIDGVVIQRSVDVGQTVAASFQAPELFQIANDLTQMQVLADIDEADVGQLGEHSRITFTVDAYPQDVFEGKLSQIRLNPQTVQNVVTYTAVIDVRNPELKLKPGMTANVTAVVAERKDILKVPNAALRFRPESAEQAPGPWASGPQVWKLEPNGSLHPVAVTVGLSDGMHTEVRSDGLNPGDRIATGENTASGNGRATGGPNPMAPFRGR